MVDRANEEVMDSLHRLTAEYCLSRLNSVDEPVTAAELNVIIRFLKDNGITSLPDSERISNLGSRLMDAVENDGFNVEKFRPRIVTAE